MSFCIKLLAPATAFEASVVCKTVWYSGAIFTAVWALDVVAPPTIKGIVMLFLVISLAKYTISSSDGVINPLSAIISTLCFMASLIIFSGGTITPKSIISKLLQLITTDTMFLPISCTSPFTVAIKIFPAPPVPEGAATKLTDIRSITESIELRTSLLENRIIL